MKLRDIEGWSDKENIVEGGGQVNFLGMISREASPWVKRETKARVYCQVNSASPGSGVFRSLLFQPQRESAPNNSNG